MDCLINSDQLVMSQVFSTVLPSFILTTVLFVIFLVKMDQGGSIIVENDSQMLTAVGIFLIVLITNASIHFVWGAYLIIKLHLPLCNF